MCTHTYYFSRTTMFFQYIIRTTYFQYGRLHILISNSAFVSKRQQGSPNTEKNTDNVWRLAFRCPESKTFQKKIPTQELRWDIYPVRMKKTVVQGGSVQQRLNEKPSRSKKNVAAQQGISKSTLQDVKDVVCNGGLITSFVLLQYERKKNVTRIRQELQKRKAYCSARTAHPCILVSTPLHSLWRNWSNYLLY